MLSANLCTVTVLVVVFLSMIAILYVVVRIGVLHAYTLCCVYALTVYCVCSPSGSIPPTRKPTMLIVRRL